MANKNIEEDKKMAGLIRDDLISQLESQLKYDKYQKDMVEDYIFFFNLKQKLKRDINKRGLRCKVTNGNGIKVEIPNESIANLIKVNTQMLKILTDLNLKEVSLPPETNAGDEDDLL